MYIYFNLQELDLNNISIFNKIKNKNYLGYFMKIVYNTSIYSINNLILHIDIETDIEKLEKLEYTLLDMLNETNLKPIYKIKQFINRKAIGNKNYLKINGFFLNNYNYGIIYKLVN